MTKRDWMLKHLGADAFEQLSTGLAGSELQSVLLEVTQRRAAARSPKAVLDQFRRDPFCAPASLDLRTSVAVDGHLLAAAHDFEGIELSPVAPMGVCSVLGPTSQNRVLTALRSTEVVADPTNVLALECASRLRAEWTSEVHLATSHRVIRAQPVPRLPGYQQHFRIFVLASAGLETGDHGFAVAAILRQIHALLRALDRLEAHGYDFGARRIEILSTPARRALGDRVVQALGPGTGHSTLDHAYYSGGLRYQIWVTAPDGNALPLADGGIFDWLSQLTSNRRAVYVASGIGASLIGLRFRKD